jgi:hypothetical protein
MRVQAACYQWSEAPIASSPTRHMVLMNRTAAGFGDEIEFRRPARERSAMGPWRPQLRAAWIVGAGHSLSSEALSMTSYA